jgi:transposase-like protein
VIAGFVRWYLRYTQSYRDVEELLAGSDVHVHERAVVNLRPTGRARR